MNLDELRAVQDREREKDSLQHLRDSFYEEVGSYIADLRAERDRRAEQADDPFADPEVRRLTDEIETAEEVAESVYERRMGKVVKTASLAAAGYAADTEGLTEEEAELFDDLVDRIERNTETVLDVLTGTESSRDDSGAPAVDEDGASGGAPAAGDDGPAPSDDGPAAGGVATDAGGPGDAGSATDAGSSGDAGGTEAGAVSGDAGAGDVGAGPAAEGQQPAESEPAPGIDPAAEAEAVTAPDPADAGEPAPDAGDDASPGAHAAMGGSLGDDAGGSEDGAALGSDDPDGSEAAAGFDGVDPADADRVTVRITDDVGEIVGVDGTAYDLTPDTVVTLPEENAEPLLEKDAATRVE